MNKKDDGMKFCCVCESNALYAGEQNYVNANVYCLKHAKAKQAQSDEKMCCNQEMVEVTFLDLVPCRECKKCNTTHFIGDMVLDL